MNRILRGPFRRLAVQIALGSMVVVLLVGVLVIAQVDRVVFRIETERFQDNVERSRAQFADQFSAYHDLVLIAAIWVASLDPLAEALEASDADAALREVEAAFAPIGAFRPRDAPITVTIYDPGGALVVSSGPTQPAGPPAPPSGVQAALERDQPLRLLRLDPHSGAVMSAAAPIRADDGVLLGVLDLIIPVDEQLARDYARGLGVEIAFVSHAGTAVTSAPGRFESARWPQETAETAAYLETTGERYLASTLPATGFEGEPIGVFYFGVPESTVSAAMAEARAGVFRIVAGGVVVALVLSFAAAWFTTSPIRGLMVAARRIQANDLDHPVRAGGTGELRSLGEAMEEMRLALRQGREALLSANEELASRVDMSTANLTEITHELGVIHRALGQLDGEPPGGLPGVAEALAELEWTSGAVIALATEEGRLSAVAIAQVTPGAAAELVDLVSARIVSESIDDGWYVPETSVELRTAGVAARGIGGFALQPVLTPDGLAGFVAVTAAGRLALTPQREELVRAIAREVARTLERSELADEVEENRRIAESVLREMHDGVLVLDHTGICRICNPAAARLLGRGRSEIVGQHATLTLPVGDRTFETMRQRTQERSDAGSPLVVEVDGRQLSIAAGRFADPDPASAGIILILRDLSAEAEAEAERLKQDFVFMVGHELRTPLTLIRTTIDLLYEGDAGWLNETQERVVGVLRNNSDRLMSLIGDLLDMSALDSGRMQISPDWVDVGEAVRAAVKGAEPVAAEKQHGRGRAVLEK